ncbi:hypothetical protein PhCBS80983_g00232 [Powellomyces hirtus]|uniref:Uncharacterized protein n=1 Tax=Powellomyces hirtus TaxID=109895 RepID=A0A507EFC4_9FUNG|nr:hypothetical protein PhCBS80983_g00232 [Powellomyces hirtus]
MTSLIAPLGCWIDSPFATPSNVTAACGSEDGNVLVLGFEAGVAWIFNVDNEDPMNLRPKVMLAGHKSRISVITLGKIEVEGVAKHENMILTASDLGEAIMWDIVDGRCLQATTNAYDGSITAMKPTSSGKHIICAGQSPYIAILDSSSLTVLRRILVYGDWIESLSLYPTDTKYVDRIYHMTIGGELCTSIFDGQSLTLARETVQTMERKSPSAWTMVEINRFDKSTAMLVYAECCSIFTIDKNKLTYSCKLPSLEGNHWRGGKFLSAKSVLLWTASSAYLYYIGSEKEIMKTDQISTLPDDAVILFSRGGAGVYVKRMETGPSHNSERSFNLITELAAENAQPGIGFFMCHMHAKVSGFHHQLAFSPSGEIECWSYFAGQNIKQQSHSAVNREAIDSLTRISPDAGYTFNSLWPLKQESHRPKVKAVTSSLNRFVALGYDTGDICVMPIAAIFQNVDQWQNDVQFTLRGHSGAVTCLFAPNAKEAAGKNVLISGGEDCTIKIWNMDDGKLLASLVNHAGDIRGIFSAPLDAGLRFKNTVLATAKDNSVSVIDMEELRCHLRLSGHPAKVIALHWRTLDDLLIVECVDGNAYVWQLKTGHLDRVLPAGPDADDILESCDCAVNCVKFKMGYRDANIKRSLSTYPLYAAENAPPVLVTFLINTKRLINEIYGQQTGTPPPTPPLTATSSSARIVPVHTQRSTSLQSDTAVDHQSRLPPMKTSTSQNFGHQMTQNFMEMFRSRPGSPAPGASSRTPDRANATRSPAPKDSGESMKDHMPIEAPDMDVVQSIFEALLTWGVDKEQDAVFQERAELSPPGDHIAFGMRGANGHLSFMAPSKQPGSQWTVSSSVSAARLLNIFALARAIFVARGLEEELGLLITFYGGSLPSIIGRHYAFPSFSYLAKYWQDPVADVQIAARTLFSATLQRMSAEEKAAAIEYWRAHLPVVTKHNSKLNMRAVLILGIIGSIQPELLDTRVCKDVAESLDQLLREETPRNVYRIAAVELLGSGFPLWEPHINGTAVLRTLIAFSGLATPNLPGSAGSAPPPNAPPVPTASPAVMVASRLAIVQIASCNAALFISTLTMDLMHSKSASERAGSLKLLGMFIAKKPLVLLPHLGRVVEAIVKCLDPNLPHLRDALQGIVTVNFAELVKRYPNVAFHHASQRLAVGTMEGVGNVYDVRIAAKVQIMEGHTKSITAVSFSPDGKLLASFSIEEGTVRIWQPAGGFLGTLVGALTTGHAASGAAGVAALASVGGVGHMKSFRTFTVSPPDANAMKDPSAVLESVRFEWKGERQVMLHSINGLQLAFSV